jgi:nitric oxide reductase activation protein
VLQAAARSAAATALALQAMGVPCVVAAFSSNGRQAVRLTTVKTLHQPADDTLAARLLALGSGGSTRLGAALRHAAARLMAASGSGSGTGSAGARWVLLLSDGQPHDIDVHDPRYLVDDARHAVQAARRRAVRMACLTLGATAEPDALRIFGRAGTQTLADTAALPRALRRLTG